MQDVFDIIGTTRSMRRLKPDPVPDALIRQVLEAGTCAANGGNMQSWRFLVIRDPAIKQAVAAYYKRAWTEIVGPRYRAGGPAPGTSPERFARMLASAEHLAEHLHARCRGNSQACARNRCCAAGAVTEYRGEAGGGEQVVLQCIGARAHQALRERIAGRGARIQGHGEGRILRALHADGGVADLRAAARRVVGECQSRGRCGAG